MRSASSIQLFHRPKTKGGKEEEIRTRPRSKKRTKKAKKPNFASKSKLFGFGELERLTGKLQLLRVYVEELAGTHGGGIGGESPESKINVGFPASKNGCGRQRERESELQLVKQQRGKSVCLSLEIFAGVMMRHQRKG